MTDTPLSLKKNLTRRRRYVAPGLGACAALGLWAGLGLAGCDDAPILAEAGAALRDCKLKVRFDFEGVPEHIGLAGDFNDFDARKTPLVPLAPGRWGVDLELPPGAWRYRVEVDGRPWMDAAAPLSARHAGAEYSLVQACDGDRPAFALTERTYGPTAPRYTLTLARVQAADALDAASVRATVDGTAVPVGPGASVSVSGDVVRFDPARLPEALWTGAHGARHVFRLEATDAAGRAAEPLVAPYWHEPAPFRWREALIYQVFTDRFATDHDFTPAERVRSIGIRHGGDLQGVLRKLREGYFETLGVNTLWLSPMNLNPDGLFAGVEGGPPRYESYHAYWPIAPRTPDPRFGDADLFDALVQEAHQRGLRVLLDVVLNHLHAQHPYFTAHPGWFTPRGCYCGGANCSWSQFIEVCWFVPYLPDFAFADLEAVDTQVNDTLWWVERFQLDGLRVDAVPMMPRFVTRRLSAETHRRFEGLGTRHYLVGETFVGPDERDRVRWYLGPDGIDGQFDFPLMWAIRQVLVWDAAPLWQLADQWRASAAAWAGSTAVMGVFAGNHDVTRLVSEAAGQITGAYDQPWNDPPAIPRGARLAYQKALLAQAFVLTVPGAPTLFQGDEFGMPGANDPDNRRPMRFGADRTEEERWLFDRVARLGRLRRCLPALQGESLRVLREEAERLVYLRDVGDGAPAVVVLGRATTDAVAPHVPADLRIDPGLDGAVLVDVLSGQRVRYDAEGRATALNLDPHLPAVLVPADHPCAAEPVP